MFSLRSLLLSLSSKDKIMGLPLRITFNNKDYVYEIINGKGITKNTNELQVLLDSQEVELFKDGRNVWVQKESENVIDPELAQALGRAISLRLRM